MMGLEVYETSSKTSLGDAWDEADTGQPPCTFCRREVPCECNYETCMCDCGRCMAPPLPLYNPEQN